MPPGLFGSTTIDRSACMEKTNTRGTAGATGVVVASKPVSKMAADITDGRALGGVRCATGNSGDHAQGRPAKRCSGAGAGPSACRPRPHALVGQTEKHSARADVFRSSPKNVHWSSARRKNVATKLRCLGLCKVEMSLGGF